jgi:hypothetical protein
MTVTTNPTTAGLPQQLATVVQFTTPPADPKERGRRAEETYRAAYDAMSDEAKDAGLEVHGGSTLFRMFSAGLRCTEVWRLRVKALERALTNVLASDALPDEQRISALKVLHGEETVGRNPHLLSDAERRLIDHYRASAPADKQMLRTLVARLAVVGGAR